MIKVTWREETVESVTMVSDVVEAERVDASDSAARFHRFGRWRIIEFVGEVAEVGWNPERQKGVLLFGEVLNEQVGRTVESVDHAPNVLQIVAKKKI